MSLDESIFTLKEVLNTVRYDWPQVLQDNANPIEMAVGLLDDTSVGMAHRRPDFELLHNQTQQALRAFVRDHHELFNNSIGSYHQLLQTLGESQEEAHDIKNMLEATTREVHDRSDALADLSQTSTRYKDLLEILDAIQEVTSIPDRIDRLVGEKKIHEVYDVISQGYDAAKKHGLWQLPALASIQAYLEVQSNNLFDMIVDELQNEIYLKTHTFFSWHALLNRSNHKLAALEQLLSGSATLEQYVHNSANLDFSEIAGVFTEQSRLFESKIADMHEKLNAGESLVSFPQTLQDESYQYIFLLLRTASKLNRLHQAVEVLSDAHQSELHALVSRSTEETKSRHSTAISKMAKMPEVHTLTNSSQFSDSAVVVLQDLFGGVFIKLLAVLQRHKVVAACVSTIEGEPYNMEAVFNGIAKEIESLVVSYIHDSPHLKDLKDISGSSITDVLRMKELFRFEDAEVGVTTSPEDLQKMLQEMFPGFVLSDVFKENTGGIFVSSEAFRGGVEVLVPRSVFNMRIVLEFFLLFVAGAARLREEFPSPNDKGDTLTRSDTISRDTLSRSDTVSRNDISRSDTISRSGTPKPFRNDRNDVSPKASPAPLTRSNTSVSRTFESPVTFFSAFMNKHFISHVRNSLEASFQELVGTPLRTELITLENRQVIYENAMAFQNLFIHLCTILNTSFTYRPAISNLALHFLENFGKAYSTHYSELLDSTNPVPQYGRWMAIEGLTETSRLVMDGQTEFVARENELMLSHLDELSKDDCLDSNTFNQVCYLFLSASWILTWLPGLKKVSAGPDPHHDVDSLRDEWSFLENGRPVASSSSQSVFLALDVNGIGRFNSVTRQFERIGHNTTLALRYDLRCKALYYISKSYSSTDWMPVTEPGDADQPIALLNKDVFQIDNKLTQFLDDRERDGIFAGLAEFLNDVMIKESRRVSKINSNGIKRVLLNIHTLQQMLRNILKDPEAVDFTRASVFFEMFTMNEFTLLNAVEGREYEVGDYENMARMMYSEKLADGGTQFNRGKYNELLRKIRERCHEPER